jgi:hypothetical protein
LAPHIRGDDEHRGRANRGYGHRVRVDLLVGRCNPSCRLNRILGSVLSGGLWTSDLEKMLDIALMDLEWVEGERGLGRKDEEEGV